MEKGTLESVSMITKTFPLAAVWLLAFLSGLYFINDWQMQLFGAAFVFLIIWFCLNLSRDAVEGWQVVKSPVLALLGALWLWMFCSVLWSEVPYVSLIGFCLSSVLPLTFYGFVLSGREADFKFVSYSVPVVMAGLAVWALIQFYVFNAEFEGQACHPLANPNSLAALFNLGLFPALGVMMMTNKKWLGNTALAFALLMFGGVTATSSRGALVVAIAAFIVFLVLNPAKVKEHWKCIGLFVIGAGLLYFATSFGAAEHAQLVERMGKMASAKTDAEAFTGNRNNIWAGDWEMIKEKGLIGTGIGTFFLYYPQFRVPTETTGVYLAHSDPLQYWAELGILGLALFYALGVSILIRTIRAVSKLPKGSAERAQIWAVFTAIFACILHTHFTFNLYVVPILFVLGFLLAWWFRRTHEILKDKTIYYAFPNSIPASYRSAFVVLPLVMLGCLFTSFLMSEIYVKKAKEQAYAQDMDGFTKYVNLADELSFGSNYRPYLLAVTVPISILEINQAMLPDQEKKDIFGQAWTYLDNAERLNPQNPAVAYYRGYLLDLVDDGLVPEEALDPEEYYLRAVKLNPMHLGARMALLDLYSKQNEQEKFEDVLEKGLNWQYNTALAMEFYSKAQNYYIMTKQPDKFVQIDKKRKMLAGRIKAAKKRAASNLSERLFGDGDTL